jgi:hypothetical protein
MSKNMSSINKIETQVFVVSEYLPDRGIVADVFTNENEAEEKYQGLASQKPAGTANADPTSIAKISIHVGFDTTTSSVARLLEGALCAWEWMLENQDSDNLKELWSTHGTAAMRHCAMRAGDLANRVYQLMTSKSIEFADAYDFEFVPAVMHRLDWPQLTESYLYNRDKYEPDLNLILTNMMSAMTSFVTPKDRWAETAKRYAQKKYCYPQLIDEHVDRIDFNEDPADWVDKIAKKYDLNTFE